MPLSHAPNPRALITEPIDETCLDWLSHRCDISQTDLTQSDDALDGFDALVVRTYTQVDNTLLERLPDLRVVGRAGVGLDNVDLHACRARDIVVVHTPDANTDAVVEHTIACVLDGLRPRLRLDSAPDADSWKALRDSLVTPKQLGGATLGILGLGRIGSRLARVARALDMRVIFHDIRPIPSAASGHAQSVPLDELLAHADVLSIHVDGRPENRHLVDATMLAQLKPDCVLINTSRGFVLNASHLARWLAANPDASAFLDVHEPEPIPDDYPLLGLINAHLTPHVAAASAQAKRDMSWVVRDVWAVLQGNEPRFRAV
ncbi:MAG: NAD(P)-dependent oxidoreductase [Phycisphaerales bacterium JB043]